MMTISSRIVEFVASFEGFAAQLYNDPAQHATIGFGHLVHTGPINGSEPVSFTQGINREQALALLQDDLKNAESNVIRLVSVPLRQHQFDALVSFAFNVGRGNFSDSDLLTRLNQNDYAAVPKELNRWIFGNGQRLEGLVRRREREGRLFSAGQYKAETVFTNQDIINAFAKAESALGREAWSLLTKAGLDVFHLAEDRQGPFSDASIETALGRLNQEERRAVQERLPDGRDIPPADGYMWLKDVPALWDMPLTPPPVLRLPPTMRSDAFSNRMVRAWNRYGWLLSGIAEYYAIDVEWVLAIVAVERDARAFAADGRVVIHVEPTIFWQTWGQFHPDVWASHFTLSGRQTQWRTTPTEVWRDRPTTQTEEWELFNFIRSLDETAALSSVRMGLPALPGSVYTHLGYISSNAMLSAFSKSDRAQILGWFDFIAGPYGSARRLHALHDRDIPTFAALHYDADRAADSVAQLSKAVAWWRNHRFEQNNT